MTKVATFQSALETVESLPTDQQADLLDILRRRFIDSRRQAMAEVIKEARSDYSCGKVKRGSVDDLLKDLGS
jgi:hypothetical protein